MLQIKRKTPQYLIFRTRILSNCHSHRMAAEYKKQREKKVLIFRKINTYFILLALEKILVLTLSVV